MMTIEEIKEKGIKTISPQKGFQEKFVCSSIDVVFGGGVLNPQPLDALIATPSGFKRMGDIKVGDIISDPYSGMQKVLIVQDKGIQPCVEFILQDGRTVRSAYSHNWLVKDRHGYIKEMTAKSIMDYIDSRRDKGKKHVDRLRIPMSSPVIFDEIEKNKLHPYLLGCLLGDGCLSEKLYRADIGSADIEVIEKIRSLGYNVVKESSNPKSFHYCLRDKFIVEELKNIGLWGHLAYTKFIPDSYKYASLEDRMELLRGLFDTDGYCSMPKKGRVGRVGYRTVSKKLAEDIQELIWSIGGRCSICITPACIRKQNGKNVNCATSYGLSVWTKDDRELFYLERKKKNVTPSCDKKCATMLSIMDYKIISPEPVRCISVSGKESQYLTNNYVITLNCGKTFSAILSVAEPALDGNFRATFFRRTFGELKMSGGMLDDFKAVYNDYAKITSSENPKIVFPSKASIEMRQINDENPKKITEQFKGLQSDLIYLDELTSYNFFTFKYLLTRNRGKAKWTGKFRGTTNPKKNSWVRRFIDWYIDPNGEIYPERDGVIRYFYIAGDNIEDVVWGDTKEEVYQKCKIDIDKKLSSLGGDFTYKNMIKSFTFYLGRMSENKASISNNMDYAGSVAASGGKQAEQLINGNWNVDDVDDSQAELPQYISRAIENADPQTNGDCWVTADLADKGTDNFVALAWNGFHIIDILILPKSTPRRNALELKKLAEQYDIADSHIIFDGNNALYINDYIPDAIGFISYNKPYGKYSLNVTSLKDACYMRLVYMIKHQLISFSNEVLRRRYYHTVMKDEINVLTEFVEECSVIAFKEVNSGKKKLLNKKEMNTLLGKGRSMDLLDPIAMRLYPVLNYDYGDERLGTMVEREEAPLNIQTEIFNDDFWA